MKEIMLAKEMNKKIYEVYAESAGITYIMQESVDSDGLIESIEVVGFYYGEPDSEYTKERIGELKIDLTEIEFGSEEHEEHETRFREIFSVMKELSDEGSEFFQNAIAEYNNASNEEKQSMKEWLCSAIDDSVINDMGIRTALILMQYE